MNSVVKIGLIAGGAYIVSKYVFGFDPLAGLFGTVATPQIATSPQAANPNAAIQANTKSLVVAAATAGGAAPNSYQTVDVWNYYYNQVRGIPGPAPEQVFPGVDRNKTYSVDEWWNALTGAGFSGIGYIAHRVNPYENWQGTPFGDNLLPTGMEKYIIRIN